ncbi:MAG: HAD family hydrolase [Desulfocapsaceae bacterium]
MLGINRTIGVLWDMDGVITDSGEAHFISWKKALDQYDLPFTREFFHKSFGMNNRGILSLLFNREVTEQELETIGELKEELFRQDIKGHLKPLPGVIDWLQRFYRAGIRQAVASSAPQQNIDAIIDELELGDMFDALVSGSKLSGKPDPATFFLAAESLGVNPVDCLVIEDATVGVEAARLGGMKCVAVCTTHPRKKLHNADIVVDRLEDLKPEDLASLFRQ